MRSARPVWDGLFLYACQANEAALRSYRRAMPHLW